MILSDPPSDSALVHRAQRGDADALVALYRRYVKEMYGYAFHQLGDPQDAEDLTSEVFMRVVNGIGAYRSQSSFRTWLYAIAHNQVRDHWRRNGRRAEKVGLDHASERVGAGGIDAGRGIDPERDIGSGGEGPSEREVPTTSLGQRVLAQLPAHYRRVLELRVMDGRSVRDTAEELGITENHVKVLNHRALKRAAEVAAQIEIDGRHHDDA